MWSVLQVIQRNIFITNLWANRWRPC